MADFTPKSEHELTLLSDEQLLDYYGEAVERGSPSAEKALSVLVMRYWPDILRRCQGKLPDAVAEDVAGEAVLSAITSRLDGRSEGEFHKWLHRIVGRRIADYLRRKRVDTAILPEEHADDEDVWGASGSHPDETGIVGFDELLERVLDRLSDVHREVIERFIFEDLSAEDAAAAVNEEIPDLEPPMSVDNVSQIAKRFRDDLRGALEEAEAPPEPPEGEEPSDEDPDNPT